MRFSRLFESLVLRSRIGSRKAAFFSGILFFSRMELEFAEFALSHIVSPHAPCLVAGWNGSIDKVKLALFESLIRQLRIDLNIADSLFIQLLDHFHATRVLSIQGDHDAPIDCAAGL